MKDAKVYYRNNLRMDIFDNILPLVDPFINSSSLVSYVERLFTLDIVYKTYTYVIDIVYSFEWSLSGASGL